MGGVRGVGKRIGRDLLLLQAHDLERTQTGTRVQLKLSNCGIGWQSVGCGLLSELDLCHPFPSFI